MLAKLGVLALLLVSPLVKATFPSSEQLEAAFDASTSPCKDLYRHVCSYDNEVIRQFVEEAEWGLMKQLAEFAVDDPVYKAYVESFLKGIRRPVLGPAPKDEEGFGKHLGRIYASGGCTSQDCSKKISFICNATTNEFEFLDLGTEFRSGTIDAVENRFVKGFVLGYLATLGFSSDKIENFMVNYGDDLKKPEGVEGNGFLAEYGLRAKYLYEHWWMEQERHVKETSLSCKSQECKKLHAKNIIRLAREPVFAPYFNVLFAKLFYERPKQTKPENIVEMENLVAKIKGRIVNSFDNATYLEAGEKEKVVKYLKNLDVVIGIPKNLRNHEELATLLQEFQEFVLEGFSSSESGALGKIINRISIFRNRRAAYNKNLFQPANKGKTFEGSIFRKGAGYGEGHAHIYAGYLHPLTVNMPSGFKHGYIAWTIGRQILHGLGLTENRIAERFKIIHEKRPFKEALTCYKHFYGSEFCMDGGRNCPNGTFKSIEGFADVESARIVFSVLRDDARSRRSTRGRWGSQPVHQNRPFLDDKWFFKGMALATCDLDYHQKDKEAAQLRVNQHPRATIRTNAIAHQMKSFAKLFQCPRRDPNYTTEPLCAAYDIKDDHSYAGESAGLLEVSVSEHASSGSAVAAMSAVLGLFGVLIELLK